MSELHDLTGLEQAAAIKEGTVSSVELTEHYLARAHELGEIVGAFVTITEDLAREQATRSDGRVRSASDVGPADILMGVACPIKDLDFVSGVRCRMGSAVFDEVPGVDEEVVTKLRAAGLVFPGKTNTPELGLTCYTEPEVAPPARTPWDLDRSAGGSSGGAAAAVAAGLFEFRQRLPVLWESSPREAGSVTALSRMPSAIWSLTDRWRGPLRMRRPCLT